MFVTHGEVLWVTATVPETGTAVPLDTPCMETTPPEGVPAVPRPTIIVLPEESTFMKRVLLPSEPADIKPRVPLGVTVLFWMDNSYPSLEYSSDAGDSDDICYVSFFDSLLIICLFIPRSWISF